MYFSSLVKLDACVKLSFSINTMKNKSPVIKELKHPTTVACRRHKFASHWFQNFFRFVSCNFFNLSLNPFVTLSRQISLVILLNACLKILIWFYFGEFSTGSTNNPLIDVFLYSHHLSAWYCKEKFYLSHSWELNS